MKIPTKAVLAVLALGLAGCASERRLEGEAKISKAEAEKVALAQAPDGTIKESELEKEHGKLIWSFDIARPGQKDITEVNVDAISGELVGVEKEKSEKD